MTLEAAQHQTGARETNRSAPESGSKPERDLSQVGNAFDINSLTETQQIRLTHVLDKYLQSLEQGDSFDAVAECKDEPELLQAVVLYLEKLNSLYGIADEESEQTKAIPQTLGNFTLIREIGRGGMGIVYEATQKGIDRRVALKLLPLTATFDNRQIERFKNESRAAGGLQHPNIVPVYSVGEAEGVHYYAMQLIAGISADQWIRDRTDAMNLELANPIPSIVASSNANVSRRAEWRQVVRWAIAAADALHSAHETGVVHRDIKPSNLMIDEDAKIWITDFGLARCQTNLSLTRSGDVIGTMRYMSPEQACGESALVDGRSDIYSLAATIYEMLSLQPAHGGDDGPSILKTIDDHNVIPLRKLCPILPRDLETVIAKAMEKRRDGRYETAAAFAEDLRRVLADEPTVARPPTPVDRLTRWASKHRRGVLVSLLVVSLGFVGLAISNSRIAASAASSKQSEQLARGAVDLFGARTAELLADIPAAQQVRRTLLRDILEYYKKVAVVNNNQTGLQPDLAMTYGKIGTIQRELGAIDEAIAALRASESLYEELANQSLTTNALQLKWSISQNNLAEALQYAGHLEEAARNFAQAIRTQETLFERQPRSEVRRQLATTLNNLGLLLAQTHSSVEAETHYLRAADLLRSEDTAESTDQQQLGSILANLSALLSVSDPARAIAFAQDSLSNHTAALQENPSNAVAATQVVVTLNSLGTAQSNAGQTSSAIVTFERAIEISQQLLSRLPDQPTYQRDLVISLNHLGLSQSKAGQLSAARQSFESALEYQRRLATEFAADPETQSMLGGVLNNLGFLHQQLGDHTAALRLYTEAVEHQSAAVELAPEVDRYRNYLEKHQHNLEELRQAT